MIVLYGHLFFIFVLHVLGGQYCIYGHVYFLSPLIQLYIYIYIQSFIIFCFLLFSFMASNV